MLLALLEGRCDADALFFSRDLKVIGEDMEAMLAMREKHSRLRYRPSA